MSELDSLVESITGQIKNECITFFNGSGADKYGLDNPNPNPDMSQYLKSYELEILKIRLLALKREFARLESKWSRLDKFTTDLENFNLILDGYKNTIPPESYVKLSSVVDKLKAALK